MTHAYKQTLVDSYIKDPDRGTSEHKAACMELALNADKYAAEILPPFIKQYKDTRDTKYIGYTLHKTTPRTEVFVERGSGQYSAPVGFIDVFYQCDVRVNCSSLETRWSPGGVKTETTKNESYFDTYEVLIEYKSVIDVGECIKQINLYTRYADWSHRTIARIAIVASCNPISDKERKLLGLSHIYFLLMDESSFL